MEHSITSSDVLVWINIGTTIAGFVLMYVKISERVTRIETHLFHVMRGLGMKERKSSDLTNIEIE